MRRFLLLLFAFAVVAALAAGHYFVRMDVYRGFTQPVFVDIPKGTSSLDIGRMLAASGVIRDPWLFLLARLTRPGAKPLAGEYLFDEASTPARVFARIARGDVYMIELRVPEGSNVFDIAALVERAGLGGSSDFVKLALPQEGYLFPSTYRFKRSTPQQAIVRAMRAEFDKVWERLAGEPERMQQTVTLASLVEREAVLDAERPHIAGVYANRLERGMKLDCDPTVEYAALLDGRWHGVIYKSDLASLNRYNTYQHAGLPPGPIANPGEESLKAALRPAQTADLYFVAKPDHSGGHVFNESFSGHEAAVATYRHGERKGFEKGKSSGLAARPKSATR